VTGVWVEGEEGDTGASLFVSGILLPVPHGKLVELRGSLTVKQTKAYESPGGWPSVHGVVLVAWRWTNLAVRGMPRWCMDDCTHGQLAALV
jgi:hypothetical protein